MKKYLVTFVFIFNFSLMYAQNAPAPVHEEKNQPMQVQPEQQEVSDDTVLEYIKSENPMFHEKLMKLKETEPNKFNEELKRIKISYMYQKTVEKENPALFEKMKNYQKHQGKINELLKEYVVQTDETNKQKIKTDIISLLSEQLTVRIEQQNYMLEKLRQKIKQDEAFIKATEERRTEILENNFDQLVGLQKKALLKLASGQQEQK